MVKTAIYRTDTYKIDLLEFPRFTCTRKKSCYLFAKGLHLRPIHCMDIAGVRIECQIVLTTAIVLVMETTENYFVFYVN